MPLTHQQYQDEAIYRQIKVSRYATGQANYARSIVDKLNEEIAKFLLKKELIETKGQYAECRVYIQKLCIEYRDRLYRYLEKELREFVKEQSTWVYQHSPVKLKKAKIDKIARNIFFEAFSDNDNIKSYVQRIFNQVYQLWNNQLSIAYRIKLPMKDMVELVMGKENS